MGLSKSFKKVVKSVSSNPVKAISAAVNPIWHAGSGLIKDATGLSREAQLMTGAGIGGAAYLMAPGAAGGGATAAGGAGASSANGVMRAFGGGAGAGLFSGLGATLLGAGAGMYAGHEQADAQRDANRQNMDLAREQMTFSAGQAQKQMDFQERMSGTSYQRAVDDMKKAGINPMLAVGNGGASSPSGSMGSVSMPDIKPVPSVVASSLSSAVDMMRTYADVRKSFAEADSARAQADSARADANLKWNHLPRKSDAESGKTEADSVESKFRARFYEILSGLFDRIKGSYNNAAKGSKMFFFIRKGEFGPELESNPFNP